MIFLKKSIAPNVTTIFEKNQNGSHVKWKPLLPLYLTVCHRPTLAHPRISPVSGTYTLLCSYRQYWPVKVNCRRFCNTPFAGLSDLHSLKCCTYLPRTYWGRKTTTKSCDRRNGRMENGGWKILPSCSCVSQNVALLTLPAQTTQARQLPTSF